MKILDNMKMSSCEAFAFALTPNRAEKLESISNGRPDVSSWSSFARKVHQARNALYFGVALTTIAATGAILFAGNSMARQYACTAVGTLGAGLAAKAAKKLYDATSDLKSCINRAVQGSKTGFQKGNVNSSLLNWRSC